MYPKKHLDHHGIIQLIPCIPLYRYVTPEHQNHQPGTVNGGLFIPHPVDFYNIFYIVCTQLASPPNLTEQKRVRSGIAVLEDDCCSTNLYCACV